MYIQTEKTPNPNTLKFVPGCAVMGQGGHSFMTQEEALVSPLATRLFAIEGVIGVFLGADFISVSKSPDKLWEALQTFVISAIMDHYLSGAPLLNGVTVLEKASSKEKGPDSEIVKEIKELLDARIRPAVARDGGDIVFEDFDEEKGIVYLRLQGACSGCPSSTATLKNGIENMLRHYIPEVKEVRPTGQKKPLPPSFASYLVRS